MLVSELKYLTIMRLQSDELEGSFYDLKKGFIVMFVHILICFITYGIISVLD